MTTTADISGATRTVFVVADPILQVKTPSAQNAVWTQRGADVVTLPAHVASDELSAFLAGLRSNRSALGAVITIPHKQSAGQWCDELGPYARMAGAVNVIRRGADGREARVDERRGDDGSRRDLEQDCRHVLGRR